MKLKRLLKSPSLVTGSLIVAVFLFLAVFGDFVAPHPATEIYASDILSPPSAQFLFGTDGNGMDVFSRVIHGAKWAFFVAIPVVLIGIVLGVAIGLPAGYFGGTFDEVTMRFLDALRVYPIIILALAITSAVGPSVLVVILVIGFLDAPLFARLVRAETVVLRGANFVEASVASGNPVARTMFVHLLPNVVTSVFAQAGVRAAWAVRISATLSFLGVGIQPPTPEWGAMIRQGTEYFVTGQWWVGVFPGLALIALTFGFNLISDGAQDLSLGNRRR